MRLKQQILHKLPFKIGCYMCRWMTVYWNNLKQTDLRKLPHLEVLPVTPYQTSNLSEIHLTKSRIIEFISIKLNEIAMICYNKSKCHCQHLVFFSKNRKISQYFAIFWDFLQVFAKICNKLQKYSNIFEVCLFMVSTVIDRSLHHPQSLHQCDFSPFHNKQYRDFLHPAYCG